MLIKNKKYRNILTGLSFVLPNVIGFMLFTFIPLIFSFFLAFTNWDLKFHNIFKNEAIKYIGFDNFIRLFNYHNFYRFLGNTLFLMLAIPFSIAGSLFLAVLLSKDLRGGKRKIFYSVLFTAIFISAVLILVVVGMKGTVLVLFLTSVTCLLLVGGIFGGATLYRTLFYIPSFTSGVAIYLLWKKLYNPHTGPINAFLKPILDSLTVVVNLLPKEFVQSFFWISLILLVWSVWIILNKIKKFWRNGEAGYISILFSVIVMMTPIYFFIKWLPLHLSKFLLILSVLSVCFIQLISFKKKDFSCSGLNGFGNTLMLSILSVTVQFTLVGLGIFCFRLPENAAMQDGLTPPQWLTDYHWAKPAIIIMTFWLAIGSRNMLLYIAGLSAIPQELYEAANIDGASSFQKFWNVTWPQLAPTTFFIVIMSAIQGLQGGFEMARAMTRGGPAGATTTLSYFIYSEGFETGRLGYASAIAWTLFLIIFILTIFNWKVGNKYVND
jgi:multiple sugar transport system permease protein